MKTAAEVLAATSASLSSQHEPWHMGSISISDSEDIRWGHGSPESQPLSASETMPPLCVPAAGRHPPAAAMQGPVQGHTAAGTSGSPLSVQAPGPLPDALG